MELHVKIDTGRSFTIHLAPSDLIKTLKSKVQCLVDISLENYRLFYAGKQLHDCLSISDYNISNKSVLHSIQKKQGDMLIFVKTLTGGILSLDADPHDLVEDLKYKIAEKYGTSPYGQRLMFRGRKLDDLESLAYYNIKDESIINMVLELKGGIEV